ncbi:MAG TPA: N-acetylmuramoyl-L-alanine amidase [Kofleriaceae bacterium]|nr:N-acetylmuramoyl-L-alanine amidase [Kofleriaceae bacterium]
MTAAVRSPLAIQADDRRHDRRRRGPVWGMVLHQTGRGIVARAARHGVSPLELALSYYAQSSGGTHYVIDYDGKIYQVADDDRRVGHVGVAADERRRYLSGEWERDFSAAAVKRWHERWPGRKSPQHLYPTRSPNSCYVGCEMLPLEEVPDPNNPEWTHWFPGMRYTESQHRAAGRLAADLARRHGWPEGWQHTSRLVGHEDIDAYGRWQRAGGWDPGALRERPWVSWSVVLFEATHSGPRVIPRSPLAFFYRAIDVR